MTPSHTRCLKLIFCNKPVKISCWYFPKSQVTINAIGGMFIKRCYAVQTWWLNRINFPKGTSGAIFRSIHFYFPKLHLLERWLNEDEHEGNHVNTANISLNYSFSGSNISGEKSPRNFNKEYRLQNTKQASLLTDRILSCKSSFFFCSWLLLRLPPVKQKNMSSCFPASSPIYGVMPLWRPSTLFNPDTDIASHNHEIQSPLREWKESQV